MPEPVHGPQAAAGELDGTEGAGGYLKVDLNTAPRTPGGGGGGFGGGGGRGGFGGRGGRGGRGGGRFDGGGRGRFGDSGRGGRGGAPFCLSISCGAYALFQPYSHVQSLSPAELPACLRMGSSAVLHNRQVSEQVKCTSDMVGGGIKEDSCACCRAWWPV